MFFPFLFVALVYGLVAHAQSSAPQFPVFAPLAVKTPYLSTWTQRSDSFGSLPGPIPMFYTKDRNLPWAGLVRVDGQLFQWLDGGYTAAKTVANEFTPTRTIYTIQAGPVQFNVTFFTPIEPDDYVLQSIPFSYLYLDAFSSLDSQQHTVQVYSDIMADWVTRTNTALVGWDVVAQDGIVYHRVFQQNPQPLARADNSFFAEDSTAYYAMANRTGHTWQIGPFSDCRKAFNQTGALSNTADTKFRAADGPQKDGAGFAHAVDLGTISPGSQPDPVVWAIGLVRDPLVAYPTASEVRRGFYWSQYSDITAVVSAFLNNFNSIRDRGLALDNRIVSAASQISAEYADLVSLLTRQIFASMDITLGQEQNGSLNSSDIKIFMKDVQISNRANPVEVLYGALPALLYFNSSIASHLLEPLLERQTSSPFAAPDLGTSYPTILGNSNGGPNVFDNTASMLIMLYAHAVKSGDGNLLSRYYTTLARWADYLVSNTLAPPSGSISVDNLSTETGLSNLVIKGILGIYSMAKINEALGIPNSTYMESANRYVTNWTRNAVANNDHIATTFQEPNSWGLIYNLFPAVWLDSGLVDNSTLRLQANFYAKQASTGQVAQYGIKLDSSLGRNSVHSDWTFLTAAAIPDDQTNVRDGLIHPLYQRAFFPVGQASPLPVVYDASSGEPITGRNASPFHGAAYTLLALSLSNQDIKADPITFPGTKTERNIGGIVGGVIGGLAGVLLVLLGLFFWRRRRLQHQTKDSEAGDNSRPYPYVPTSRSLPESSRENFSSPQQGQEPGSPTFPLSRLAAVRYHPAMTEKERRALGHHINTSMGSEAVTNNPSASGSGSGSEGLRQEVDELRRELEFIRREAVLPPAYT